MSVLVRRGADHRWAVLAVLAVVGAALVAGSCARSSGESGKRVIVLGFDGMDHGVVTRLLAEGKLPNLSRLAEAGGFTPLETSVPPQSPVAWSDFTTGMDAGGHGIFDFVHRDPETMLPYLSTSRAETSEDCYGIGSWKVPGPGKIELLRRGVAFWEVLEDNGVESWIVRMPANFPPSGTASYELSGMGTPDALGTPGEFSFYTSELFAFEGEDISGGEIYPVDYWEGIAEATLYGPPNNCLPGRPKLSVDFTVHVDPVEPVAKLVVGDEQRLLMVGEWSDWLPIYFPLPLADLQVMARFYLKSVRPELELYVTPFQIDPESPAMPISTPDGFAAELAEAAGPYYTQGMPEDTKALTGGVLDTDEFLEQAAYTGRQFIDQYEWLLDRFESGFLFYYFGNLDQVSHVLWDTLDPGHPAYDAEADAGFAHVIESIYEELDGVVGDTLDRIDNDTTLIVMSDHGFGSYRRVMHLNNWLEENGYLVLKDPSRRDVGVYRNVDWSRTRAYGLGLNGLYINVRGRERDGIVAPEDRLALMEEIAAKLLATVDPKTAEAAVTEVWRREQYRDSGYAEIGPDIQVGYAYGTGGSGKSAIGDFTDSIFIDNLEDWPGNHCWDHTTVPGVLFANRDLGRPVVKLTDLAGAILAQFGIEGFPNRQSDPDAGS
jgi:predicted AlkP superfamily phosphohydrolase/phosphomutase